MNGHLIEQYRSLIAEIHASAEDGYLPAPLLKLAASCEEHAAALERETVIRWEEAEHVAA